MHKSIIGGNTGTRLGYLTCCRKIMKFTYSFQDHDVINKSFFRTERTTNMAKDKLIYYRIIRNIIMCKTVPDNYTSIVYCFIISCYICNICFHLDYLILFLLPIY